MQAALLDGGGPEFTFRANTPCDVLPGFNLVALGGPGIYTSRFLGDVCADAANRRVRDVANDLRILTKRMQPEAVII